MAQSKKQLYEGEKKDKRKKYQEVELRRKGIGRITSLIPCNITCSIEIREEMFHRQPLQQFRSQVQKKPKSAILSCKEKVHVTTRTWK
jgi:hypothetical protein